MSEPNYPYEINDIERRTIPIWVRWNRGEITDEEALRLFVAEGVHEGDAREAIFFAKGGSDIVGESDPKAFIWTGAPNDPPSRNARPPL